MMQLRARTKIQAAINPNHTGDTSRTISLSWGLETGKKRSIGGEN